MADNNDPVSSCMCLSLLTILNQWKWYEHNVSDAHSIGVIFSFVSNNTNILAVFTSEVGATLNVGF